jgi:predicted membrane-bound dolichyl-phosphate-mannose-protein mannosyltransferase
MDAASIPKSALRAERGEAAPLVITRDVGDRISIGTVAGVAAGLLFLLANMAWATKSDLPAVAPLLDISTIFYFDDKPTASPENMAVGLITHLALSAGFGIAFAILTMRLRNLQALIIGGLGFGLALYLVNFQILGRLVFEWFLEGPDQWFEVVAHLGFGLLLVPFFLSRRFLSSG